MIKFFKKVLLYISVLLLCSIVGSTWFFYEVAPQYLYGYPASILDKIDRLEKINEPKIILAGNSNLAFGIDSRMIEDAFGMPVVNLGFHGGLSNAFHERMVEYNLNEGDIVVLVHTSYANDSKIQNYPLAWITLENHSKLIRLFDYRDYWGMLCAFPSYVKDSLNLWKNDTGNQKLNTYYSRLAFNEYGDVVLSRKENTYQFSEGSVKVPKIDKTCLKRINDFNAYCREQNATLLVAGYPIGYGEFTPSKEDFIAFQNDLEEGLECEIISCFTDYFIEYEYFYDTNLHLTDEGVRIRTQQLIEDIKNWQAAS